MPLKKQWTQQEDQFLRQKQKSLKSKKWVLISQKLNEKFGGQPRSAKQCRQRFLNHASIQNQEPFSNQWNLEQTQQLFSLYQRYGPKWTIIAHHIVNKSQNIVKNKFYSSLRKFVRKLNKFLKQRKNKYRKQIKYESIIRVIDFYDSLSQMFEFYKQWSYEIRKKILQLTYESILSEDLNQTVLDWLGQNINKFNLQTRSFKSKKPKHHQIQKSLQAQSINSKTLKNGQQNQNQIIFQDYSVPEKAVSEIHIPQSDSMIQNHPNSPTQSGYSQAFQQQLYQDFGKLANHSPENFKAQEKNIFIQLFPEDFAQCNIVL